MAGLGILFLLSYVASFALITFFVASEVSFSLVRGDRLERLIQRRSAGSRRLAVLQRSHDSLAMGILVLRSAATAIFALYSFAVVWTFAPSTFLGVLLGGLVAVGGVVLAQAAGQVWARHSPERLALALAPVGALIESALSPVARGLTSLFRPLVHRWSPNRRSSNGGNGATTESEAPENGHETEDLPSEEEEEWERQVIRGVLRLESISVREIMVPRPDIAGIRLEATLEEAIQLVLHEGYSRIPLYEGTLDTIRGVLYAKDLLAAVQNEKAARLEELARPALLIPETKRVGDLLREFQTKRVHIALVIDEYGSLVGLVTNEDLLEEIVGEIEDEFTVSEPLVEQISTDEAIVDARAPLKYVSELFGVELEAEGFDTLGGLIYHRLGRIPTAGETVTEDRVSLTVLTTAGRRIRRVRVSHSNGVVDHSSE